ncbi:hypothetical protein HMI55_000932 [Coelomomyces lativittatus]|nr:hypothetical protein HMI56_001739 [Coelomomyces lativittatus]KAJ1507041.1 hypothetical protein HMI55_000932 [Coelomomyces lativittatus]
MRLDGSRLEKCKGSMKIKNTTLEVEKEQDFELFNCMDQKCGDNLRIQFTNSLQPTFQTMKDFYARNTTISIQCDVYKERWGQPSKQIIKVYQMNFKLLPNRDELFIFPSIWTNFVETFKFLTTTFSVRPVTSSSTVQ